jgi:hypothetical protein
MAMLRAALLRQGWTEDAAEIGKYSGFVAVAPLVERECRETGLDDEAVAGDADLIESGRSQEPLAVQYRMNADPFDRRTALWVLGRCAWEDATRWLAEFAWLLPGPDLWLAVAYDYSLGTGATRNLLRQAQSEGAGGWSLGAWVTQFVPAAIKPPFANWWGRAKPAKVQDRLLREVRCLKDAATIGPLETRCSGGEWVAPPPAELPPGCAPMPAALRTICERLISLRKRGLLTHDDNVEAWTQVRAYARTLDRARRQRPRLVRVAAAVLPRFSRHPEAALDRRLAA